MGRTDTKLRSTRFLPPWTVASSLLFLASCSSTTGSAEGPEPAALRGWPPSLNRLTYLPVRVRFEVEGQPLAADNSARGVDAVQRLVEQALNRERLDVHRLLAVSDPWQRASQAVEGWLGAIEPCNLGDMSWLPNISPLLTGVNSDAAVFLAMRINAKRGSENAAVTAAGLLAGAAAVATTATLIHLSAGASGTHYTDLTVFHPTAQVVVRSLSYRDRWPLCVDASAEPVAETAADAQPEGDVTMTIAVLNRKGELIWYRSGRLPLLLKDAARIAPLLGELFRGPSAAPPIPSAASTAAPVERP